MRLARFGRLMATLVVVALLAGCGGGGSGSGPSSSDPTQTVKDMFATMTAGNYDKIADYACAAEKDKVSSQFDPSSLLGGGAMGLGAADLKQIVKISVDGLTVTQKSKDASAAVVSIAGKMKFTIDKDKFKELLKKALASAGQPVDDATLNLALGMVDSLAQGQDISSDMNLVLEGGKWLICS
jgi:hypothetical protein